ncbi:MAG: signal peptidase I [Gemmatimonadota bacterium]|nr:signal peptidase I [Gemmatimonadota bacterium]
MLTPGLGHLYLGEPWRALAVWALAVVVNLAGLLLAMRLDGNAQLLVLAAVALAVPICVAWDAAQRARAASFDPRKHWYARWYVYLAIVILPPLLALPSAFLRSRIVDAYHVPSNSMAPAIVTGDYILARLLREVPQRGQVVVFRNESTVLVKRVIGMPGDTIAMTLGTVIVNGHPLAEPYAVHSGTDDASPDQFAWQRRFLASDSGSADYKPSSRTWGPLIIPAGRYMMLGDNRDYSEDGRYYGFIDRTAIISTPTIVYFSRDPSLHRTRWSRIGAAIH